MTLKKRILSIALTLCMSVSLLPVISTTSKAETPTADTWDGTASYTWFTDGPDETDGSYHISTAEQLAGLANLVNFTDTAASGQSAAVPFSGETIVLDSDIDLNSGVTFSFDADTGLVTVTDGTGTFYLGTGVKGNTDGGNTAFDVTASVAGTVYTDDAGTPGSAPVALNTWVPIGSDSTAFSGTFDGGSHTVSGIYISAPSLNYQGLFGYGEDCTIGDINLDNGFICGADQVGGAGGYLNRGSVSGCMNSCTVIGCGEITPYYTNYYVSVHLGGIVGSVNDSGCVSDCRNTGVINSIPLYTSSVSSMNIYVGGVVGYIQDLSGVMVSDCVNSGSINTDGTNEISISVYAGGVLGYIMGYETTVSNCENHGKIVGIGNYHADIGGVAGYVNNNVSLSNCTNTGDVTGSSGIFAYVGGVAGFAHIASLAECQNTGHITSIATAAYAGGIVATASASSITDSNNEGPVSATGTAEAMAMAPPRVLTTGVSNVTGGIAGYFYYEGAASNCRNSGEVSGAIVASNTLNGNARIGGVIGYNNSNVINSSNTANVTATGTGTATRFVTIYTGGVTGHNTGTLSNSYNTGNITDTGTYISEVDLGGVTGMTNKLLKNCYNTGSVTGVADTDTKAYVGSVAGFQTPSITSELSDCYWLSGAAQMVNGMVRADGFAVGGYYYSGYQVAGTDDYATNFSYSKITDCYSFDGSGTAWVLSGGSYDIPPASGGSAISLEGNAPLVDALNAWVDTVDYVTWASDRDSSPVNGGYPVLSAVYKPTLSGTPTIMVTNGYGESADQMKIGATLTATPSTTPDTNLSYQWQVSENGSDGWTNATGSGNSTDTYTVSSSDAAKYLRVMVTSNDAAGAVYSAATAQVPYTIKLTQTGNTGTDSVSFSKSSSVSTVYALGSSVTIYSILSSSGTKSNTIIYSGGTIASVTSSGTSSSSYVVSSLDVLNGVITIQAAFVHTNYGDISGMPTFSVTNGFGDTSDQIKIGATLTAEANTTPSTNLSYQWEVSEDGSTGWTNASGTGNDTAVYTVAAGDAAKYLRVKVTSSLATSAAYSAASVQVPYTITLSGDGITDTDAISFCSSSSVSTIYAIGDTVAIYYLLGSNGTQSNKLYYSGADIPMVVTPGVGNSAYSVSSGDASDGVIAITATFMHTNYSVDRSSLTSHNDVSVIVNGKPQTAGTLETTTENGKTKIKAILDTDKLEDILNSEGEGTTVIIPIKNRTGSASGVLTGRMVKEMEEKAATLVVETGSATYTLPAEQMDIDHIAGQFGADVELSEIEVAVTISEPDDGTMQIVENSAEEGGFTIVVQPVKFTVTCTYNGQTTEVTTYNVYVERKIEIPDGVDPDSITTAVVVESGGAVRHVPTRIVEADGASYAVINSLTNSVYTLINSPVKFADVDGHWAQDAVNDMASRKVISGYADGTYNPEGKITRAEFAAIIVRALGLKPDTEASGFSDVSESDWNCGYIETSKKYGLIAGYPDGMFGPNDTITREQAVTIIARAMKITGLEASLSERETSVLLGAYSDGPLVSDYAVDGIAACLQTGIVSGIDGSTLAPQDNVSRAEVAVMVQRLLQKSELI